MERMQPRKGHSPTGDHRGRGKSGHGNKATKKVALTPWSPQKGGQVRKWKEKGERSQNKR